MADELVILGADGTEHVFPPGFDPKRAAAIVRGDDAGAMRRQITSAFAQRPIADIGAGAAMLGAQSDPREVVAGALGALNPLNWLRGAIDLGHLALKPSEIPEAALRAGEQIQQHPGTAAGGAVTAAALPKMLTMAGRVREATAPFAETLVTKKLGMDPGAIDLQSTRLRLQAARSRTRQATRAAAMAEPRSTPASSSPVSPAPKTSATAPSTPAPRPAPPAEPRLKAQAVAEKLKLTPKEFEAFQGLVQQGYDADKVLKAIVGQRAAQELQGRLGTISDAQMQRQIADRNAAGRWPTDR